MSNLLLCDLVPLLEQGQSYSEASRPVSKCTRAPTLEQAMRGVCAGGSLRCGGGVCSASLGADFCILT